MLANLAKILKPHRNYLIFLILTWGTFFSYLFSKMIVFKKDGLYLGNPNVWSDWTLHITLANIFAFKNPSEWFSYHPLFAGGKLTYPFLIDFISGIFMRIGLSLNFAFLIPSIFFSILLIVSMYFLFFLLSKSKTASVIGIFIYFLSSGLGFLNFISDFISSFDIDLLIHPIKEYSRFNNYDWYTGNVIVGLLLPQRSFLIGLSLGILSLSLLILVLNNEKLNKKNVKFLLFISGLLAGILPIAHPHSFIVLVIIGGILCITNINKLSKLIFYIVPAGILSTFLFLFFIQGGIRTPSYISLLPGWGSKGVLDFIYMWFIFWGLGIPLSIFSFFIIFKNTNRNIKMFFLSLFGIFIISNIILFQPIKWDNTKVFWWVYVGVSILSASLIVRLYNKRGLFKPIAIAILISFIFTGVIEINKLLDFNHNTYLITTAEDILLGEQIRNSTNNNDVFLTAPKHNNLVMMWGLRPIFLGYTAWVFNFGFNYNQREKDLHKIYQGGEETKNLLKENNIKYVLIGPYELNDAGANEAYFSSNFPIVFSNSQNRVYKIRD